MAKTSVQYLKQFSETQCNSSFYGMTVALYVLVQDVRFTLDRCSAAIVSEIEGPGKWLSTEDRTNCEVTKTIPQRGR